ncbi:large conductance mechanosensitive channel protein MscL [Actinoplanes sp. NPDC051861]|uniref:large conductance mechanosensitive channel protein MscL n=1 Tax=Actinoplanes sp. NPDC051861 TaxID=3155170 RepID=UPI0034445361
MFQGFKDFIMRGNVVDLAVGVVIGTAFTAVVSSFTKSFLEPLIKWISGGKGELAGSYSPTAGVEFTYAIFLNSIITFLLTAAVLYFLVVFPLNKLAERRQRGEEPPPKAPSEEIKLLTEIRDALVAQSRAGGQGQGNVYGSAVDEVLQRRQEPPR